MLTYSSIYAYLNKLLLRLLSYQKKNEIYFNSISFNFN